MAHSNRVFLHRTLVACELILFIVAVVTAYLSQNSEWPMFFTFSALAFVIFAVIKLVEARPALMEILLREDLAAKIAASAIPQGAVDYFDMQKSAEQDRRNRTTQNEVAAATAMWLCANSGASYLDPGVYRHWPAVERRLKEGVEFRVVLLDPFSAEKGFRNRLNVDGERFDSKLNVPGLIKLYNTYPTLEVRFVRYGMHATVFATAATMFIDPYHVGVIDNRIENRSICLQVKPATPAEGVGLYRLFKGHLDTLWRSGASFEEWIEESKKQKLLPEDMPALKPRQYTV
ncbi:hypothetical protein ACOCG7_30820 [Paraburkholderia sp. DD10]|uniref:hypothetical protein n=1 Tax=Paraburkholderia sp. DD10 TaxID=3409691 RepID=UPI003BA1A1B9